ncbi:MAG: hypothetical protein Q8O38_05505 [Sulfurimicrobium sp.]|nr:hypothetical protein [Sulfurimicrobium sp.]
MSRKEPGRMEPERKVLLAVREDSIDQRLLSSALSLCKRMDAGLEILAIVKGETLPLPLQELLKTLRQEGLYYSLTRKPALRRRDIVDYANTHECVSAVVIDSLEGWESLAQDRNSDPWKKLACPLVTAAPRKTSQE